MRMGRPVAVHTPCSSSTVYTRGRPNRIRRVKASSCVGTRQATQASPGDATHTGTRNAAGHHWARAFRVTIHSVQAALDCRIASRRLTSPPHRLRLAVHSTRPASLWPVHADLLPQSTVPRQGKVLTRLLIPDLIIWLTAAADLSLPWVDVADSDAPNGESPLQRSVGKCKQQRLLRPAVLFSCGLLSRSPATPTDAALNTLTLPPSPCLRPFPVLSPGGTSAASSLRPPRASSPQNDTYNTYHPLHGSKWE